MTLLICLPQNPSVLGMLAAILYWAVSNRMVKHENSIAQLLEGLLKREQLSDGGGFVFE